MRKNRTLERAHGSSALSSAMCVVAATAAFVMSFWAEPFEQEIGYGRSFLGYNRDWLVNGRWYFFAAIVVFAFFATLSLRKAYTSK